LDAARQLGTRTAELHVALASDFDDPAFAPEPFTEHYQRSLYQSMRASMVQTLQLARRRAADIPVLKQVLDLENDIASRLRTILDHRIAATRIRCHGDYHLGQALYTGKDFVLIDFEGEPARPLGVRRLKRTPLFDVAGMLRSFHYAAYTALEGRAGAGLVRAEDREVVDRWTSFWYTWVAATFLGAYLHTAEGASFLPRSRRELEILLDVLMLEKALYELNYEMNNRPDWVRLPVHGIVQLLEAT
jgi:maltose alpha-D-glucosyltransferase/alpha-amylase